MTQQVVVTTSRSSPPRMSYEEYLEWLDDDTHAEWVNGEVIEMSPIEGRHQQIGAFLLAVLQHFAESKQPGAVFYEPFQMKSGPGLPGRSPDILYLADEHRRRLRSTYLDGPADLVVEIVSPESRHRDHVEKLREYEQGGVREYWIIDPEEKTAEFFALATDGRYEPLTVADGAVHSRVLTGLWLKVEWFQQEKLPPILSVIREWGLV